MASTKLDGPYAFLHMLRYITAAGCGIYSGTLFSCIIDGRL